MNLKTRLDGHFVACGAVAAAAAVGGIAQKSEAAIVYSGVVNIVVPDTIDGLYMNVVTGANASFPPPSGWDINPYSALAGQFHLWGPTSTTWFSTGTISGPYNLAPGTPIGGASTSFFRPGGGTNVGPEMNLNSSDNLLGFRFAHEGNAGQIHHGWVRFAFGADEGTRSIVEYAYDDVAGASIPAGAIPTPGSAALLALGAAGLVGRRRR